MITDWATYKAVTGDVFTSQAQAEACLARAQRTIESRTGRLFDQAERTESLPVSDGKVWPSAYPLVSVSVPDTASVDGDGLSLSTGTTDLASTLVNALGFNEARLLGDREQLLVTYVGGYASGAAPADLVDCVCELAQRYAMPANTAGVPAGATSVQVGGQSYSGGVLGGAASIPPALKNEINRFRHIRFRMAD